MTTRNRIAFPAVSSNLKLHKAGLIIKKNLKRVLRAKVGGKRGSIGGFSYQARQRLRRYLLVSGLKTPWVQFGVTLTVPGSVAVDAIERFKEHINRFFLALKRAYPSHGVVYRVELQQRGMPHLHLVVFCPLSEFAEKFPDWERVLEMDKKGFHYLFEIAFKGYRDAWMQSLFHWEKRNEVFGASIRAVHYDALQTAGAIRYLCDHQSKAKVVQLGYTGKQWGIIGRRNLIEVEAMKEVDLTSNQTSAFLRAISRLRAGTVNSPETIFGRKVSRNRRYRRGGVLYGEPETIKRLVSWVQSEYPAPIARSRDVFNPAELPD